jgi:hypothetical protein
MLPSSLLTGDVVKALTLLLAKRTHLLVTVIHQGEKGKLAYAETSIQREKDRTEKAIGNRFKVVAGDVPFGNAAGTLLRAGRRFEEAKALDVFGKLPRSKQEFDQRTVVLAGRLELEAVGMTLASFLEMPEDKEVSMRDAGSVSVYGMGYAAKLAAEAGRLTKDIENAVQRGGMGWFRFNLATLGAKLSELAGEMAGWLEVLRAA